MPRLRVPLLVVDLFLTAAIAGFFYAYSSSVMRGLDAAPPEAALVVMKAINATVRNAVFAPSFFGPMIVGLLLVAIYGRDNGVPAWFARAAALVYVAGGFGLTLAVNVPMNEGLATAAIPSTGAAARELWTGYSVPWTAWNTARTVFSFVSFGLLLAALMEEARRPLRLPG